MTADETHLTDVQRDYFATLRRLAPDPAMERHIQSAIRSLDPNRPAPVQRAFGRGLWRGFLAGLGIRRRPRMKELTDPDERHTDG